MFSLISISSPYFAKRKQQIQVHKNKLKLESHAVAIFNLVAVVLFRYMPLLPAGAHQ